MAIAVACWLGNDQKIGWSIGWTADVVGYAGRNFQPVTRLKNVHQAVDFYMQSTLQHAEELPRKPVVMGDLGS